jgi:hypothetical protein
MLKKLINIAVAPKEAIKNEVWSSLLVIDYVVSFFENSLLSDVYAVKMSYTFRRFQAYASY